MAEYRIVAKVDPQTSSGSQKVRQDLRGIQTEARATENALNRSFDQAKFDKTIGALVTRLGQLDDRFAGMAIAAVKAEKSNDQLIASLDRLTAANTKAGGAAAGNGKANDNLSNSNTRLENTLRRVLQATDAEAAEQLKLNMLLKDATLLNEKKLLSDEKLLAIQKMVAASGKEQVAITGQQRIGMQQLGFQLGDIATMYSLGAKPAQIFGSQIGQVSQALMLMGGKEGSVLSKVAGFLGGPWGIALTVGTILLGPFLGKLLGTNDALGEQIDKLKKDAAEAELSRQAHERWSHTLDGMIERQWKFVDAMKERMKIQGLADQTDLAQAQRTQAATQQEIAAQQEKLRGLRKQLSDAQAPIALTGGRGDEAALGAQAMRVSQLNGQIKGVEDRIRGLMTTFKAAQGAITSGQILVAEQQGKAMVDATARVSLWADNYKNSVNGVLGANKNLLAQGKNVEAGFSAVQAAMEKAATAGANFRDTGLRAGQLLNQLNQGKIGVVEYRNEMIKLAGSLTKAAEAAQKAKTATDGVARFRSAQQAIGIAGRELQSQGLRVSENVQFGGVSAGVHKGTGHGDGRAVDVNKGKNIVEADVPDLKSKFDAMAKRYAARGYIVLWNGQRYDPSGKVTPIPGGQDQHRDHMHLEAPKTIIGKATQASTEAQFNREENMSERTQERAEDFVKNVVRQAATQGLAGNAQTQLDAAIKEKVDEYDQKFKEKATAAGRAEITKALTDADARETARRFEEAYVDPLKRLEALQGKVGLDREILNAQLDERKRRGRELTDVEKETIANGITRGDQLTREAQLLSDILAPMQAYKNTVAALNHLLADGSINQAQYNARLLEAQNAIAQKATQGVGGVDPTSGRLYEDQTAIDAEKERYAAQLVALSEFRETKTKTEEYYNALDLAAYEQHQQNLAKIDQARREVSFNAMSDIAGNVTSIMKNAFGEQSKIARAAFAAEKAIAIARSIIAIQEGIAQAAKLPFPANLPAIASVVAATASIVSNIRSVSVGYKKGGWTGDGSTDREAGAVHGQEFVVKAPYAAQNRSLLEAINNGRQVRQTQSARAAQSGGGSHVAAAPVVVPAPQVNLRQINVTSMDQVRDFFESPEGEQVFVNLVGNNSETIRRAAGGGVP